MTFLHDVRARAAAAPRRIVFPETTDERTLTAVRELVRCGIVHPVLIAGADSELLRRFKGLSGIEVLDPAVDPFTEIAAVELIRRRRGKGLSKVEAHQLVRSPLYFADALVAEGRVDGCVAGAVHTTADVVRAALWLVGPADGARTISSAFYMVTPPFRGESGDGREEVLTFTDCAVVRYPTAPQLADIALAAAADRRRIVGDEPIVALLSFSTHQSAAGPSVNLVREAVGIIRGRAPGLVVDGELQVDAAIVAEVSGRKAPGSAVAGRANVLVFPSLDAGNIAYKLVERLAGASAVGPILQGLRRPCSDLSRGAVVDDIINVAAITALQAGGAHELPRLAFGKETLE